MTDRVRDFLVKNEVLVLFSFRMLMAVTLGFAALQLHGISENMPTAETLQREGVYTRDQLAKLHEELRNTSAKIEGLTMATISAGFARK